MHLSDWYTVTFDETAINLDVRPPAGTAWNDTIAWASITRVCFKAGDLYESDEIYLFTNLRPESWLIPTEARGGSALWGEIIDRKLFDAELAIEAATSSGGIYCTPPIDAL